MTTPTPTNITLNDIGPDMLQFIWNVDPAFTYDGFAINYSLDGGTNYTPWIDSDPSNVDTQTWAITMQPLLPGTYLVVIAAHTASDGWSGFAFGDPNGYTLPSASPTPVPVPTPAPTPTPVPVPVPTPSPTVVNYQVGWKRSIDWAWNTSSPIPDSDLAIAARVDVLTSNTVYDFRVLAEGSRYSPPVTLATTSESTTTQAADGTFISHEGQSFTDVAGNVWGLTSNGTQTPFVVTVNGTPDLTTSNVIMLAMVSNMIHYQNKSYLWFAKQVPTQAWQAVGDPRIGVPTVTALPTLQAAQTVPTVITYHGGQVLNNVNLVLIYWGLSWIDGSQSPNRNSISTAINQMITGNAFIGLSEYGIQDRPIIINDLVTTATLNTISTTDIATMLQSMLSSNNLQYPTLDNHLFMVIFPSRSVDPNNAYGSHSYFDDPQGRRINFGYVNGSTNLDDYTVALSIVLMNAITNPHLNGWYGITQQADGTYISTEVALDHGNAA